MVRRVAPDVGVERTVHLGSGAVADPPGQPGRDRAEVHPARVGVAGIPDDGVADLVDQRRLLDAGQVAPKSLVETRMSPSKQPNAPLWEPQATVWLPSKVMERPARLFQSPPQ